MKSLMLFFAAALILQSSSSYAIDRFPVCAKNSAKQIPEAYRGWYRIQDIDEQNYGGNGSDETISDPEQCLQMGTSEIISPALQTLVTDIKATELSGMTGGPASDPSPECVNVAATSSTPDLTVRFRTLERTSFEIRLAPDGQDFKVEAQVAARTVRALTSKFSRTVLAFKRDTSGACQNALKEWNARPQGNPKTDGVSYFNQIIAGRVHAILRERPEEREHILSHWKIAQDKRCNFENYGSKNYCPVESPVSVHYVGHTGQKDPAERKACQVHLTSTLEWPGLNQPHDIPNYHSDIYIDSPESKPEQGSDQAYRGLRGGGWGSSLNSGKGKLTLIDYSDGLKIFGGKMGVRLFFNEQGNPTRAEAVGAGTYFKGLKTAFVCEDLSAAEQVDSVLDFTWVESTIIVDMDSIGKTGK